MYSVNAKTFIIKFYCLHNANYLNHNAESSFFLLTLLIKLKIDFIIVSTFDPKTLD